MIRLARHSAHTDPGRRLWGRCHAGASQCPSSVPFPNRGKIGGRVQWYPFFEGDYLRDTIHLTWLEDLAYRRLLDLCYRNGGYVTADKETLFRQVRATEPAQRKAVEKVLDEFFFSRGRVKVNRRATEELLKVKALHEARVKGGKERHLRAKRNSAGLELSSSPALVSTSTSTYKSKTPLPPVGTGGLTHKVLPGGSTNGLQYIERYGTLIEVRMGRHRRLPNLDPTAGMQPDYLVEWFEHRGFQARIMGKEEL